MKFTYEERRGRVKRLGKAGEVFVGPELTNEKHPVFELLKPEDFARYEKYFLKENALVTMMYAFALAGLKPNDQNDLPLENIKVALESKMYSPPEEELIKRIFFPQSHRKRGENSSLINEAGDPGLAGLSSMYYNNALYVLDHPRGTEAVRNAREGMVRELTKKHRWEDILEWMKARAIMNLFFPSDVEKLPVSQEKRAEALQTVEEWLEKERKNERQFPNSGSQRQRSLLLAGNMVIAEADQVVVNPRGGILFPKKQQLRQVAPLPDRPQT